MSAPADPPETWCVLVTAAGDGPPMVHRVRRLLKKCVRECRLRVVGYPDQLPPGVTLVVLALEDDSDE
jgi:hypothetical protein